MSLWQRLKAWWSQPGPRRWRGVTITVPFVLLILVGIGYTNYVQRQADQRWCELVVLLNRSNEQNPPQTEQEREFVRILRELQKDLHC